MDDAKLEMQKMVGYNIKYWREQRKMTQAQLAETAGISSAHCTQVECGNKALSLYSMIRVAEALNVSLDSLVYGSTKKALLQNIIRLLDSLSSDELSAIEEIYYLMLKLRGKDEVRDGLHGTENE